MKITRKLAVELYTVLNHTKFEMPIKSRFRYMISTNVRLLKPEVEAFRAAYPEPENWTTQNKKNIELKEKYNVNRVDDIENLDEETKAKFDVEWNELRPALEAAFAEYQEYIKERDAFLSEEVSYDLDLVPVDAVPDISEEDNIIPHWETWDILQNIITK